MSKISNTLTMLKILETGRVYKISELASMLECSKRSIRTYKEDLEKAGIFIDSIPGRYGGYYCSKNYGQNHMNFNKLDLNGLENLYLNLKEIDGLNLKSLENVIDKLRHNLVFNHDIKNTDVEDFDDIYNYLSRAILNKEKLKIIYKAKATLFIPHNIYIHSNNLYITGINCELNQIRTYNIKNIRIVKK